jgi:hypothetical protein
LAVVGTIIELEHPGFGIDLVAGRQPVELGSRHAETCVLHADRIDMHFAPPADQRDDTGHLTALNIAGHDDV